MAKERKSSSKSSNGAYLGFEQKLWQVADKLRSHACGAWWVVFAAYSAELPSTATLHFSRGGYIVFFSS
jgi:hypothetical protein